MNKQILLSCLLFFTISSQIIWSQTGVCANPASINLPFEQDGAGEYCFSTSGTISNINSWNMNKVEINGVDYTNKWSNSMPERIDGLYYIVYSGSYDWSHLEINGSGGTTISVTGVTLTPAIAAIYAGNSTTLIASVLPTDATNKNVSWTSGNNSIATVNSAGVVTGISAGSSIITVTTEDGTYSSIATISVSSSPQSISISPDSSIVLVGSSITLTATVLPSNATNKNYTWSSNDTAIATVNTDGIVTGISAGKTTIYATLVDGGLYDSCTVTVIPSSDIPVTDVFVEPAVINLYVGSTAQLNATVLPTNATNKIIIWTSDNTNIITVSSIGLVTAISAGTSIITATSETNGKYVTANVTVIGDTNKTTCENPFYVTIPFNQSGVGEYCWFATQTPVSISSWNMDKVEINGVDYTNKWSDEMPEAIDGKWYIHYKASVEWAHFEAPASKNASDILTDYSVASVKTYPNPSRNSFILEVESLDNIKSIQLFNQEGKRIQEYNLSELNNNNLEFGENLPAGLYFLQVLCKDSIESTKIIKE